MKLDVFIANKNNRKIGEWITLPSHNHIIDETIEEICVTDTDRCIVTKFRTRLHSKHLDISTLQLKDLDIVGREDIYHLNECIYELTQSAIDEEIVALTEVYSNKLEEILQKSQHGIYKFYAGKSLKNLAYKFLHKPQYKHNSHVQMVDELCRLGYKETSTGVIYMF